MTSHRTSYILKDYLQEGAEPRLLAQEIFNRLETAAMELRPELRAVRRSLEGADVLGVGMTGSGSAFFAICADEATSQAVSEDQGGQTNWRTYAVVGGIQSSGGRP